MAATKVAQSEVAKTTEMSEPNTVNQATAVTDDTFLTNGTATSLAAGIVGGTLAFVGTVEAIPILAVGGAALVASGSIYKGYNAWKTRHTSVEPTANVPIVPQQPQKK